MLIDFTTIESQQKWRAVNDEVMGGRSSGEPRFENGSMIFAGSIDTNGGGFSSVRSSLKAGELSLATGVVLRVKRDERAYKITLRTDARHDSRPVSFQAKIAGAVAGQWSEVNIPFTDLKPSVHGRAVEGLVFDSARVESVGIIIADSQDGAFQIGVAWIKTYEVKRAGLLLKLEQYF